MPIAYSYKRFSSDAQSQGDSLKRQTELADRYIATHPELGLVLDTALKMTDLGVSAFKGDNINSGALGKFLEAVFQGHIAKGSYLLIESFDRFSRQQANIAANDLLSLVNRGIVVVTLNNEQTYRAEDFSDGSNGLVAFMGAFIAMESAHREQVNKGKRIAAAWSSKWQKLKGELDSGLKPSKRLTRIRPFWLDEHLNPIPEKVAILRDIYDKRANLGWGKTAIANYLNERAVPTPKGKLLSKDVLKPWNASTVHKLLSTKSVIGIFVNVHGLEIEGYYPAVIDDLTYTKVRALTRTPIVKGQSTSNRHPLTGLVRHQQCGQVMRRINKGTKGGPIKLSCVHCRLSRPFNNMLSAVELALRGLEFASSEDVENAHIKELIDLEFELSICEDEVGDAYDTYKRIKTAASRQKYEDALVKLDQVSSALADLRASNMAVVLNMEDQALMRFQGGIEAAPHVVSSCLWNSEEDSIEVTSLSRRKSKCYLHVLESLRF